MTKSIIPKNIILYADDDMDDLQLVQEAFFKYSSNVEIVTLTDGSEALSYLTGLTSFDPTPCLIILDINMPRMSGKETLVKLRQLDRFKTVPVMLFTTSSMSTDIDFATRYKAGFLTKPIDINQMHAITDKFINHCTEETKKSILQQRM